MDYNFIFYLLAGIIFYGGLYAFTRNAKDDVLNEFIKEKGWTLVSKEKDKTNLGWRINVRGKSEALYYIKYYDKSGKLHDCALLVDYGENQFKIIRDNIV